MIENITIIGSGKMAIDTGFYFLRNEFPVMWLSRSEKSTKDLQQRIDKKIRRVIRIEPRLESKMKASYALQTDKVNIKPNTLVIECVSENPEIKKQMFNLVKNKLESPEKTILTSVSSSILPSQMDTDIAGLHFFYPLEITSFAELVISSDFPSHKTKELKTLLYRLVLSFVEEDLQSAFSANRLLLPVQNEVFRLLKEGYPPQIINSASESDFLTMGQLSLMDSIGLDVIYASVKNYAKQFKTNTEPDYMIEGLQTLIDSGKMGKKNKNGLLIGEKLPWTTNNASNINEDKLREKLKTKFLETCSKFVSKKLLTIEDLDTICLAVYNSRKKPSKEIS